MVRNQRCRETKGLKFRLWFIVICTLYNRKILKNPFQNSQVNEINVLGEFPVQNQDDAKYWVAVVNFLRTASKMFFGNDDGDGLKGNPPPILHLTGYGDHMFNKVPVVIQSFNIELRGGIDYISTQQSNVYSKQIDHDLSYDYANEDATWAPTLSNIFFTVTH